MKGDAFTPDASRDAWDEGADAWIRFVRTGADWYRTLVHGPGLLRACRVTPGERALDIGCGEGWFSRALAGEGARVTGIDHSTRMIDAAAQEERDHPLGVTYLRASATDLPAPFEPASFDLVTACMALQDTSDPAACLRGAHGVLRDDGRFVFSVPHPLTETKVREWERHPDGTKKALRIDRYFDTGPAVMHWSMPRLAHRWSSPYWRHTLEEWTEMVAGAGFVIRRIAEPRPDEALVAAHPQLDDCRRVPYFLVIDAAKA